MPMFDDDEYDCSVFGEDVEAEKKEKKTTTNDSIDRLERIKRASERAVETRRFETSLFWSRGTYFWAFILASFTAYFSLLLKLLENSDCFNKKISGDFFTLSSFLDLSDFALFCLTATSLVCVFFCIVWVLVNKASRFWQENWERHVGKLEELENIKLFATYLNPKNEEYKKCLFSYSAYDYSASKLVFASSLLLLIISLAIFTFHVVLLLIKSGLFKTALGGNFASLMLALVFIALFFFVLFIAFNVMPGNLHVGNDKKKRWWQEE